MFVPNSSPARSVAEFVAFAKANRGKVKFGSPGTGTPPHLAGELLKQLVGIEMTHVPYRGASDALNDLIPGRIDLFFASGSTLEQSRAGQIRSLAVSSARRDDAAPELPAIAETIPGFDVTSWYALFVPAKTPPQIIEKLNADTVTALADPAVKGKLEQLGYTVAASTPDELGIQLKWEISKWGSVIKAAGLGVTE
jgi:tripartite-type tricarboxylate transporter receptor subunit TctC